MRIKLFMKPVTTLLGIKLSLENSQVKERFSHFGVRFGKHWEDPERDLILRYLPTGEDFIDLGGCIGFVSLLARKFKHTKKHIIVEGNPSLMGIMKTYKIKRFNLLCDIEGNEEELIESEIELLKKYCNFLIIDFDIPY